jgi:hypothetical protein
MTRKRVHTKVSFEVRQFNASQLPFVALAYSIGQSLSANGPNSILKAIN